MSLLCRLKNLVHKGILKEKDLERIVIIPKEQEPCEDCISRKDAINAIKRTVATEQIKELKRLPSIQPKLKTEVLDKIKTEIEQFADAYCSGDDINIYDVFQIIDKYTAEKE